MNARALALALLFACGGAARAEDSAPAPAEPAAQCEREGCPMHPARAGSHAEHGAAGGCPHCAEHGGARGAKPHATRHSEHAARHAAIDRLVAIEDLQQLKARYMRCIDTKDLACLRDTVFAPDTELYFKGGDYEIAVKGWPEIEKFYQGAFTPQKFGMHQVHTRELDVQGERASGIWYLHDVFVNLEQNTTLQGSALYRDEYVKTPAGWRIAKSTYQRLWEETTPRDPRTRLGSKPVKE